MKIICENCGKEFERKEWKVKRSKNNFCSKNCHNDWQRHTTKKGKDHFNYNRVMVNCPVCNKKIEAIPARIKNYKNIFCSIECKHKFHSKNMEGTNNPSFKEKAMFVCTNCGKSFQRSYHDNRKTTNKFCSKKCEGKWRSKNIVGENSPCWNGGRTKLHDSIRTSTMYVEWRTSCFERDKYKCKICGKNTKTLEVHHIIEFSQILDKYNIKNVNDAKICEKLWDTNNGVTVCRKCHKNIFHKNGYNYNYYN